MYGLYGFFFENCTDCTDFFWKCTDFCTDVFKIVLATLELLKKERLYNFLDFWMVCHVSWDTLYVQVLLLNIKFQWGFPNFRSTSVAKFYSVLWCSNTKFLFIFAKFLSNISAKFSVKFKKKTRTFVKIHFFVNIFREIINQNLVAINLLITTMVS